MFEWIGKWVETKVIEFIAKRLGVDPAFLKVIMEEIFSFIKMIIDSMGRQESVAFFKTMAQKKNRVGSQQFRDALKNLEELK